MSNAHMDENTAEQAQEQAQDGAGDLEGTTAPEAPTDAQDGAQDHEDGGQQPDDDAQQDHEDHEDGEDDDAQDDADTFPRSYVEKLRRENAEQRAKAKNAEDLAAALWSERVKATGRLADATDLPLPEGVDPMDPEAVDTAVADLLGRKPHLAARVPRGNAGQGYQPEGATYSLGAALRARA